MGGGANFPTVSRNHLDRARPRAQQRSITLAAREFNHAPRTDKSFEFANHYFSNVAAPGDGHAPLGIS